MTEANADRKLSRRQFVGTAAAGAMALGAVSLAPGVGAARTVAGAAVQDEPTSTPSTWSYTADVVIVGYGGAGAVAAITANNLGANVLVLEKTPLVNRATPTGLTIRGGGGNSSVCAGGVGYPINPTTGAEALFQACWGATPMDVCLALCTVASQVPAWLQAMKIPHANPTVSTTFGEYPGITQPLNCITGSSSLTNGCPGGFSAIDGVVAGLNIPILWNTSATHLIQNPTTNEVLGVQALQNQSVVLNVQAKRAVILTCGGYEYNEQMKLDYLPCYPVRFEGWQYDTGDGITMAAEVGAGMWHMNHQAGTYDMWFPDYNMAWGCTPSGFGWFIVDKYGNRYVNEEVSPFSGHGCAAWMGQFDPTVPEYTRIPSFMIFDSKTFAAGPIGRSVGITYLGVPGASLGGAAWPGNSAALAKGWIIEGATSPSDLANAINQAAIATVPTMATLSQIGQKMVPAIQGPAGKIQIKANPSMLTATVNKWNADCAAGNGDTVFGRTAAQMAPVSTPPFYAVPLFPGSYNTHGGPIHDAQWRVCDFNNNPIPRLYEAGELGGEQAFLYVVAVSDIPAYIATGQIAGNNAAMEAPWTT